MFGKRSRILIIDGAKTPIDPDFRIMCEYSEAITDRSAEKLSELASRFYFAGPPEGVSGRALADAMNDFYVSGFAPTDDDKDKKDDKRPKSSPVPCFDFAEDEGYFYAAFLSEYGIDLNTAKLHWLDFCALFRGLPDDCKLKQIIGIRAQNIGDIKSSAEKARIRRLKRIFALRRSAKPRFKSAADRDKAIKADVMNKIERARKLAESEAKR